MEQEPLLFERYQIIRPIGNGGTAGTYLVEHIGLKRAYALKRVPKAFGSEPKGCLESQILKILKHPRIPILYDIQEDENYYYLFEEFISGTPLLLFLMDHTISRDTIIYYIIQLCEILQYLHGLSKPVIFGDIQPKNILIHEENVYLVDFGNARFKGEKNQLTCSYGTVGFAAPEQYKGEIVDEKTDIYGAGALLYYCLSGHVPEEELVPLEPALDRIIRLCVREEPSMRYESMTELKKALEYLREEEKTKKNPSLCISIAGTRHGIGTTHISFALASAAAKINQTALCEERNLSGAINRIAEERALTLSGGVYHYEGICIIPHFGVNVAEELLPCQIRILDFGVLNANNIWEYQQADACILITGIREWEQKEVRDALDCITKKPLYQLVNFSDAKGFLRYQRKMPHAMRIPYFTDWAHPKGAGDTFLTELLCEICGKNLKKRGGSEIIKNLKERGGIKIIKNLKERGGIEIIKNLKEKGGIEIIKNLKERGANIKKKIAMAMRK